MCIDPMCVEMNLNIGDSEISDAFQEKLVGILNGGALSLMISIGHRTRLFDTMAGMQPATSEEIAAQAYLNERYVREWLGAMVTGGIILRNEKTGLFFLPPEHAASLTRAASPANMAVATQFVGMLGSVENQIVECFRMGGGVPYSAFPRFHEIMAEESNQSVVSMLLEEILPLVPEILEKLEQGIRVLDIGCGSARALMRMAERFPNSQFTGFDLSPEAVENATQMAIAKGLTNLQVQVQDVTAFDMPEKFELITAFDAIHDQAQPAVVLNNIKRALTVDGVFLMQDIAGSSQVEQNMAHPIAPFLYTISCMHCMTVSLSQQGAGLGAMWGKELACEMLQAAGFSSVDVRELPHDIMNYFYVSRAL